MDIYLETIMDECEKIDKDEEIESWKRKFSELETQFVVQKQDLVELKDYKTKYDALCGEIQENKIVIEEGEKRVSKAENELDKYKTLYDKLNICIQDCKRRFTENGIYELDLERKLQDYETQFTVEITKLVNELNGYKSRWRAQLGRHIKILGEEVTETTIDHTKECNLLYSVIESLERDIRVAEDEIDDLRTEYRELKSRSASWKKELDVYRAMCGGSLVEVKDKGMQSVGYEKDLEAYKTSDNRPREEIMVLAEARKVMSKGKMIAEENLACSEGNVIGSYPVSRKLEHGKRVAEDETEDLKTEFRELKKELEGYKAKCDRLLVKLEKKKTQRVRYKSKLKNVTLVRDALEKELEGYKTSNNGRKEDIMGLTEAQKLICEAENGAEDKPGCLEVTVLNQMEGDNQEVLMQDLRLEPNSTCDGSDKEISRNLNILTANTTKRCYDNHKYMPPLKRSFSREECGTSSGGNFIGSSSSTHKRLRVSEIFTGNGENVEDDSDQSGGNRMLNVNKRKEDVGMKTASISSVGASGSSRPISVEDSVVSSITVPALPDQQKSIVVYRASPVWGRYSSLVNEAEDGDDSSDSIDEEIQVELEPSKVLQITGRTELENSVVKYVDGRSKILNEPVLFSSWAKVVEDIVANREQVS